MDRQYSRNKPTARTAAVPASEIARRYLWGSLVMIGSFAALGLLMSLLR